MEPGYQVIEPRCLSALDGDPTRFELAVAVLQWIVDRLHATLGDRIAHVRLEVVRIEYHGA